jgi:hypothetical protein
MGAFRRDSHRGGTRPGGLIEYQLAEVLREIELRAWAAEGARLAQAVAAEERQRNWERAIERARAGYAEAHRATGLNAEVDAWIRSDQGRWHISAMHGRIDTIDDADERAAAKEWCEWAEGWAESHDPLSRPMGMPRCASRWLRTSRRCLAVGEVAACCCFGSGKRVVGDPRAGVDREDGHR